MHRYYVTFVIYDELIFITIDDWCRLSQYRESINYPITLIKKKKIYRGIGMKRQFDLISDTIAQDGPWVVLQVIYVISWWKTKKRYSFFYARVSNLANEVRGCKKTYARKAAARFKLDERESNIAISLQRSLVLERKGHIEIFRHFFPSLFSRFAPP